MIHMPKRSVTRYFIPLIDVLLLLFCIFLLMPVADEKKMDNVLEKNNDLQGEVEAANSESDRIADDLKQTAAKLKQYDENRSQLDKFSALQDENKELQDEIARLKDEIARLKDPRTLGTRTAFHVIQTDGANGKIFYYDSQKPDAEARIAINDGNIAKDLIKRQQAEAGKDRPLYYYFMKPQPRSRRYPTTGQTDDYKLWFKDVANSLNEK